LHSLEVAQIGLLVPDLREGVARYSTLLGRDDWSVFTYGPDDVDLTFRGQPGAFSMRIAFVGENPQIELIESLEGPSIYTEWIERHGYGIHHFGFRVPSIANAVSAMEADGFSPTQSGRGTGLDGDGGFAYFETDEILGFVTEFIETPARRRPSEAL
jgi:catechol 2,3-dioxygenase-like lactoylglutathione lyase family enzyme